MRKIIGLFIILSAFLTACGEEEIHVEEDISDVLEVDSTGEATAEISHEGNFVSRNGYTTSGKAQVALGENNQKTLIFSNFNASSGPDLDVYLATDADAGNYINLGDLKGTSGQFTYDLPSDVNLDEHAYIIIWCARFSVSFGHAKLE